MKANQVKITFASSSDAEYFMMWVKKCKEQEGTITGTYTGIACSTIKTAPKVERGKP